MTHDEIRATLTLCLLASFADGEKHDREREQIRQVAEGLAGDHQVNLPSRMLAASQPICAAMRAALTCSAITANSC